MIPTEKASKTEKTKESAETGEVWNDGTYNPRQLDRGEVDDEWSFVDR